MSYLVGGFLGYVTTGTPIGALVGAIAGKYVSNLMNQSTNEKHRKNELNNLWYDLATLVAKTAKSGGTVTSNQINLFKQFLMTNGVSSQQEKKIADIFNHSKSEGSHNYMSIANEIGSTYYGHPDILNNIIFLLENIAKYSPNPDRVRNIITDIAYSWDISYQYEDTYQYNEEKSYYQSSNQYHISEKEKAYQTLGLKNTSSINEIKTAYREKVKEYHPDTLEAKNASGIKKEKAKQKIIEINSAYEILMKQ